MNPDEQHVSTESQRLALEAMSAQLVHKLNAMISEQEARARAFAEQHHSTLPIPQQTFTSIPQAPPQPQVTPQPQTAPQPLPEAPVARTYVEPPPLPTARKVPTEVLRERLQPRPAVRRPKKTEESEEGNIGMGMVIFALVGIIMLFRSCT